MFFPPPVTFGFHPPCAPHIRPIRPFCVSTHSVLPHVCKIESVRRESGSQEKVGSRTEQGSRGAEQTYVDTQDRQVGSVADQQLPLPRNFSHTHLRHSALTYLNLPSNLTPLSVFSHPSISLRENIGRMRYETRSWYGRMS